MNRSTPGFPVPHYLLEFAQVHVHWIVMLSNRLIFCHPLLHFRAARRKKCKMPRDTWISDWLLVKVCLSSAWDMLILKKKFTIYLKLKSQQHPIFVFAKSGNPISFPSYQQQRPPQVFPRTEFKCFCLNWTGNTTFLQYSVISPFSAWDSFLPILYSQVLRTTEGLIKLL